jgi:hypothetical protein
VSFALGKPRAPAILTAKQVVAIARRAGWGVRAPYAVRYGSWVDPGLHYGDGRYDGQIIDAWEIQESKVTFYDPGGPNSQSCAARQVYHHLIIVVSDKGSNYIEATTY